MEFNLIDAVLLLLVLLSGILGWRRGFILGGLDLVRWIGSLLLGLWLYPVVARWLGPRVNLQEVWIPPLAFLGIVITAGMTLHLIGYALLRRLPREVHRHQLNRFFGILTGAACGVVTAAMVAPLLLALPLPGMWSGQTRASVLTNHLSQVTDRLESALNPIFGEAVKRSLNSLTVPPEAESQEFIRLPFTVSDSRPEPGLEVKMLELVNGERAAAGLAPLTLDSALTEAARAHSVDMFARGYFSHFTPEGLSPFDRLRAAQINFRLAGENLALAPTLHIAHTGLMNSPGHRANILQPRFGRVGIGIMNGGRRGLMVSQEFRD